MMKKVLEVRGGAGRHWVGNGFPVRSMFSYRSHPQVLSPFLLLDHAGPAEFAPATMPRGVGQHPHRGFETVTIVYQGEVAHRDSTGEGGVIGPGDVQWMTAGSGIVHEEFHSPDFTAKGGTLEMVQLWVNLPARNKMTAPGYQGIRSAQIPSVQLDKGAGSVRVIAGEYKGISGPASTFTPLNLWDVQLKADSQSQFLLPDGWGAGLAVLQGELQVNGETQGRSSELVVLTAEGQDILIEAKADSRLLLLSGEPIDEPVVGQVPFVMNSYAEIEQAFRDFRRGDFS